MPQAGNKYYIVKMTNDLSKSLAVLKRGYVGRKTAYDKAREYQAKDHRHYYTVRQALTARAALQHQPAGTYMHGKKPNNEYKQRAGRGRAFTFHGSYTSLLMARKKERQTPGSFIQEKDGRYYILKPKKIRSSNPANGVLIYERCLRIEAVKMREHVYNGKRTASGQHYFHDFTTKNARIYGLPDGSLLIKAK